MSHVKRKPTIFICCCIIRKLTQKSKRNILYIEELPYLFFVKSLTLTSEIDILPIIFVCEQNVFIR